MKRAYVFAVALFFAFSALSAIAQEKPWFDMKNCDFCKHLVEDTMLLPNMTWEHFDISNGAIAITTVKPEYKDKYLKAMAAMEKVGQEMGAGKSDVKMCGHCEYYGKLVMSGVKMEYIPASAGDIMLMTADKPEVLAMLREYVKRNKEEMAKVEMPKVESKR
jgi:hypothetical protein